MTGAAARKRRVPVDFPILEFDASGKALIDPATVVGKADVPRHCVVCFFREVLDHVIAEHHARLAWEGRWEDGAWQVYEIERGGRRVAFFHPGVGAPAAAAKLDEAIALGCDTFIAAGGCGVLDSSLPVGHVILPHLAVRDEGTSYHYLAPGREVAPSARALSALEEVLVRSGQPYVVGKTWTTDAPYRETPAKVARRKAEGCLAVEMEAAAFFAVAVFRQVTFGQLLYAGDDVGGEEWDHRSWDRQPDIRERLFWLAVEACLSL
ncbi:MAG TPA: nucleoside phosphorylase [Anaerolineales bacterium]|nr:nucleoside phosphorylase [Anaerolineales bacterium]